MSNSPSYKPNSAPRTFHVMTKPIGPLCNLDCKYCFYLEKEKLFPSGENYRMRDEVLEAYVRRYIQSQNTPEISFAWQGGEPTLMGLDFFRKVVALQRQYAGGRPVNNSFQTNGTNLDEEWCRFFARENFLVGLSLDGPEHIHNRYRVDKGGAGSFGRVFAAMELLKKWRVEFNTLTCVTRQSPDEAVEIYGFLKKHGVKFMQFIPIVERAGDRAAHAVGLELAAPPDLRADDNPDGMMPWAVSPEGFGQFLCKIFDEWIKADVGRVFVNLFDVALSAWCGMEPNLCTFSRRCGQAVAMEHDGGIYSCDHYVYPSYYLGNIMEQSLEEMVYSKEQAKFGNDKWDALPNYCRECEFLFACNGECPKHRFMKTPDGEPGLNYLCAGYKTFFKHIDPKLREMAALVQKGRPAADIMKTDAAPAVPPKASAEVGRNDRCPCGSGKKFKKCCGK
ncbi:Anaerobic sulfatase-maturating enzyme [Pontiella desulfatans]|uniref:Anaerobic sulfatase-maturating enzyme n=1 Tax=Pontiella desulfatans TaxID=2750659 RepID=A0A6C2U7Z3_PONDE|nr:anaerobic sulfatase maturase [Pontiella desulfatans]VGO15526.1 Anaerobic sulfatase-maturating enzyme [Pontiella desulfatans]